MQSKNGNVLSEKDLDALSNALTKNISNVINVIDISDRSIHNAVARTFGLDAWFSAYISTEEFNSLPDNFKHDALHAYNGVRQVLRTIEENQTHIS